MTSEQIDIMLQQNAALIDQNRQLLSLITVGQALPVTTAPVVLTAKQRTLSKKDRKGEAITAWYGTLSKTLPPQMAAILKSKIQAKGLWKA